MSMAISHKGKTDTGKVRQHNEDAFYPDPKDGTHDPSGVAAAGHLFIVADGVGGNRGGARASHLAVTRLPAFYYGATNGDPVRGLKVAFNGVAHEIVAEAAANPDRANMSCTIVAAVIKDGAATIAHLGDARAYLLRGGALLPLTTDHTWVQMQVEKGTLSPAEAENHPDRNVITKSMGNPAFPEPSVRQIALQEGDRLLLCSDGLCGLASDAEMAAVLNRAPNPAAAVEPLIELANRKGGTDNITALVIQAGPGGAVAAPPRKSNAGLIVGMLALVGLLIAAFVLFRPQSGGAGGGTPVAEATATGGRGTSVAIVGGGETAGLGEPTSTLAAGVTITATETMTATGTATATPLPAQSPATAAPTAIATFRTAVPPLNLQPLLVGPRPADCPPPADASQYSGNRDINFVWRLDSAPGSEGYFLVEAGAVGNMSERARVDVNTQSGNNQWSTSLPIRNLYVNNTTDYQWQVTLVYPGDIKTPSQTACFHITGVGDGGDDGGTTAKPPPPTDLDSDDDGRPDSQDECPDEPQGPDPDPNRPGCPNS